MKNYVVLFAFVAAVLLLNSCKKEINETPPESGTPQLISEIVADPSFDWRTETDIKFLIKIPQTAPIGVIKVYSAESGIVFFRALASHDIDLEISLNIPTYIKKVDIEYSDPTLLAKTVDVTLATRTITHTFEFSGLKSTTNVMADSDNDGVPDDEDDYPDDPTRAFDNSYPGNDVDGNELFNTLAWEDTYKGTGDYDFNDLVADYRFEYVTNAQNEIVDDLLLNFNVRCSGATHHNGFGFQMPGVAENLITDVSGYRLTADYINLTPNNLEAGHDGDSATVIIFDDSYSLFPPSPYGPKKNTIVEESLVNCDTTITIEPPYYGVDTFDIRVTFVAGVLAANLNLTNWNPFIIESYTNYVRCLEIHLPDYATTVLGTCSSGDYRTPVHNLPWGVNVGSYFDYTFESGCPVSEDTVVNPIFNVQEMNLGHLKFIEWVQSNGANFADWYMPKPDYRDCDFFYINLHYTFTPNVCAHYLEPTIYPYLPNLAPPN